jgi:RHH-type proline utilization regulon transcriptional repressor/proline dehydrogenase/delta 1-pyrroline-5-carboxylate dehydrogenase
MCIRDSFRRGLCDAIQSLEVGPATSLKTRLGPLIRPPSDVLETGLKELEPGESWALMPNISEDNPHSVTPGIKWDVQPGSFTHMTEFFGPLLGVMKAKNLQEAIQFTNQTGYGLTSGLESLDDREQAVWKESIRAGNLYINRGTTGAIVLRQPFGGMGKSAFGPGIKAGGPNYVAQLMRFEDCDMPGHAEQQGDAALVQLRGDLQRLANSSSLFPAEEIRKAAAAIDSYLAASQEEFGKQHDHFRLIGQDNWRRYLPVREIRIRTNPADSCFDIIARVCAAKVAGCRITVSSPIAATPKIVEVLDTLTESWAGSNEFIEESDDAMADVIRLRHTDRIRYAAPDRVPTSIREAVIGNYIHIADTPVVKQGRVELMWYVCEQSVCDDYHRYGNLGARTDEPRTEPK